MLIVWQLKIKRKKRKRGLKTAPHLLSLPSSGTLRRAPAGPPQSTSGRRTTPFAFSAWLCSAAGSASLLLRRPSPASLQPPLGPWRSSLGERSGGTPRWWRRGTRNWSEEEETERCAVWALNLLDERRYDWLVDGFVKFTWVWNNTVSGLHFQNKLYRLMFRETSWDVV